MLKSHLFKQVLTTVIIMYAIRYLRASNGTVASLFPQQTGASSGAQPAMMA